MRVTYFAELEEFNSKFNNMFELEGEHEANAVPADVDWEALNNNRETLTLNKERING